MLLLHFGRKYFFIECEYFSDCYEFINDEIIDLPGFTVAAWIGRLGSVMRVWDATNGLSAGVVAVVALMGIGMTVFDLRAPSSLTAAMKAGMRTGSGNWEIHRLAHDK